MPDHLDSTKLVPFKRRRNEYHLPGLRKEEEEQIIDQVDPELRPEEQGFVRHYLAYADVMLRSTKNIDDEEAPEVNGTSRDQCRVREISRSNGSHLYERSDAKDAA